VNLADMLSYADIHQLNRIASTYDCECDVNSKKELIQSILSTVSRREVFERQINNLTMEDLRFVNLLLFERRELFSLEELLAHVSQTKFEKTDTDEWNPRDVISRFKQWGWLFNGYSHQTRFLFQVPQDLKSRFSEALAKHFQKKLVYVDEPPVYRDETRLIADDIQNLLKYISQQDVPLTADGFLYKRTLNQLLDSGAVKEEPAPKGAWRFGYGRKFREYPSRFSLIYDYAYFHNLLLEEGDRLSLTADARDLLAQDRAIDIREVYRFWLKLYRGPIPNLVSIVHWIERLSKSWVTADSLSEVLCPLIKPYYYDTSPSIFNERIVQMMMHLGLIRIGEDETYGKVLKLTRMGGPVILGLQLGEEEKISLDPG
jgi:hypothetical protein